MPPAPEFARIENMLDKKTTSEIGMTVLMVALLSEANITHNIVLTSNRTEYRFDKNFDNWGTSAPKYYCFFRRRNSLLYLL